jgi:hypothetical protein
MIANVDLTLKSHIPTAMELNDQFSLQRRVTELPPLGDSTVPRHPYVPSPQKSVLFDVRAQSQYGPVQVLHKMARTSFRAIHEPKALTGVVPCGPSQVCHRYRRSDFTPL